LFERDINVSVPSSNGSANLAKPLSLVYDDPECILQVDEISGVFSDVFFSLDLRVRDTITTLKRAQFCNAAQAHAFSDLRRLNSTITSACACIEHDRATLMLRRDRTKRGLIDDCAEGNTGAVGSVAASRR